MTPNDRKIRKVAWAAAALVPLFAAGAYGLHMRSRYEQRLMELGIEPGPSSWTVTSGKDVRSIDRNPIRWKAWSLVIRGSGYDPSNLFWDPIQGKWIVCTSWPDISELPEQLPVHVKNQDPGKEESAP